MLSGKKEKYMKEKLTSLAPLARITLFILGGWLQGKGVDPKVVAIVQTDPEMLSLVILAFTGAWYTLAKIKDWKR